MLRMEGLSEAAKRYDLVLCDVWGVVHDGITVFADAVDALYQFRRGGGVVILVTNSPRVSEGVVEQLERLGVSASSYNRVVTSGDTTRQLVARPEVQPVYHIGPAVELGLIDELPVHLTSNPAEAGSVLCTGFLDPARERPEDYEDLLQVFIDNGRAMICANPDLMVRRGDVEEPCAGALAEHYRNLGGQVHYTGKPHTPIYHYALRIAQQIRGYPIDRRRTLAIGDSPRTDLAGANRFGLDGMWVLDTVARRELKGAQQTSVLPDTLRQQLEVHCANAVAWSPALRW